MHKCVLKVASSMPRFLERCQQLKRLNLWGVTLDKDLPAAFLALTNLQELNISDCDHADLLRQLIMVCMTSSVTAC